MVQTDYQVIIAGGGPTGMMLACELGLAGVRPLVLERLTGRSNASSSAAWTGSPGARRYARTTSACST
jgi:2-polyprenyl-6-methoxyphenol hydroxylase-like FAD-dependent oxidoreductase